MNIFTKTLFQGKSKYNGEVKVIEGFSERRLIAAGYTQSRSLSKNGLTGSYWDGFVNPMIELDQDSRVLILGLAGGTIAKLLTKKFGLIMIDGVDIDPMMVELGQKYLDFSEKNVNIIISDALKFIKNARYKYDLICVDLFAHGDTAVGSESKEFFEDIKQILNKEGIVAINKLFTNNQALKNYVDFIHEIFNKTDILLVRGSVRTDNVLVYARN